MNRIHLLIFLMVNLTSTVLLQAAPPEEASALLDTLSELEEKMHSSIDADVKAQTGKLIIELGNPLLKGEMSPSGPASEGESSIKTAEANATYAWFWLMRAAAALFSDHAHAGGEALTVLEGLPKEDSTDSARKKLIAALRQRGWDCFINSLGMKFLPVPITGGPTNGRNLLFCTTETRVRDFAAFVEETGYDAISLSYNGGLARTSEESDTWKATGGSWKNPHFPYKQTPDHPVVCISWNDANAFCAWLSKKEKRPYRLPSDHEWSCAIGIGETEDPSATPEEKRKMGLNLEGKDIDVYAWGTQWPPPPGVGNYSGKEALEGRPADQQRWWPSLHESYEDDFSRTAPVGSFRANRFGLFDAGGNVSEFCQDLHEPSWFNRVVRDGGWSAYQQTAIASERECYLPTDRIDYVGFRCVVGEIADYGRASELKLKGLVADYTGIIETKNLKEMTANARLMLDNLGIIPPEYPGEAHAYYLRAIALGELGNLKEGIADFSKVLKLEPKRVNPYFRRGCLYYRLGHFEQALNDLQMTCKLYKGNIDYTQLFVWILRSRLGQSEDANAGLRQFLQQRQATREDPWYESLAAYVLGEKSQEQLVAACEASEKSEMDGCQCEMWFYVGIKALLAEDKASAAAYFQKSLATMQDELIEFIFSDAELKRLEGQK